MAQGAATAQRPASAGARAVSLLCSRGEAWGRKVHGPAWAILAAGGVLAGIGFTMALYIAWLALSERLLLAAKIGILTGSALCAVLGLALLL